MERNPDGSAAGDGRVVSPDHVRVSGSEGARWLGGDHVLRVFETDPEEDVTVPVSSAHALCGVEGVDLQLEHSGGQNLQQNRVRHLTRVLQQLHQNTGAWHVSLHITSLSHRLLL